MKTLNKLEIERVVIRFAGDSGDGIQLMGHLFADSSAKVGNDLVTFPDYPAEIRAPQGTVSGVSSYQIQIGQVDVHTPGDEVDVLVALNPAALKANLGLLRAGGIIIIDMDTYGGVVTDADEILNGPMSPGPRPSSASTSST